MSDRLLSVLLIVAALAGVLVAIIRTGGQNQTEMARLRHDLEILRDAQDGTRSDVAKVLRRQSMTAQTNIPQREIALSLEDAPFRGAGNAPVTLVEFTEFESPACARYARETLPQLERDYISMGKLRYVIRGFPVDPAHTLAFRAHEAAQCAAEQGKFWQMHDLLFASNGRLSGGDMLAHAQALGLDRGKFLTCFDGGLHAPNIRRDVLEGQKNGVTSTPTFFIGPSPTMGGPLKALRVMTGAQPYASFKEVIDDVLEAVPTS